MNAIDNLKTKFRNHVTRGVRGQAGELKVLFLYGLALVLTLFVVWYRDPSAFF